VRHTIQIVRKFEGTLVRAALLARAASHFANGKWLPVRLAPATGFAPFKSGTSSHAVNFNKGELVW
jgi:hypothetical protein